MADIRVTCPMCKTQLEIDSEYEGEVVKAYVENGQAVQFGERLFAIRAK